MSASLPLQSPKQGNEDLDKNARLLEQAVEKLVRYGQKVGVTPGGDDLVARHRNQHSRPAGLLGLENLRSRLDLRDVRR